MQPTRLLCPWDCTGVGCHFLFQGIFPTQKSNLWLRYLLHWQMDSLPLSHLRSISSEEAQIIRAIHSLCLQYSCWVSLELCLRSQRFGEPIWRLFLQHLREASSKLAKLSRVPCKRFWCHWWNGLFCSRWMQARASQEMLYKVCIPIHTAELVVGMQRRLELRCKHPEQQSSPRSLGKWPSLWEHSLPHL